MDTIFQSSDLAQRRTEFLRTARAGRARLRDKDGMSLVMLPESHLEWLEAIAKWSSVHWRLGDITRRGVMPTVGELGELAWLRVFGIDDLQEFADELHEALVIANADQSPVGLEDCVRAWRITARQLEDPLRRRVLLDEHNPAEFEEAARPEGVAEEVAASTNE